MIVCWPVNSAHAARRASRPAPPPPQVPPSAQARQGGRSFRRDDGATGPSVRAPARQRLPHTTRPPLELRVRTRSNAVQQSRTLERRGLATRPTALPTAQRFAAILGSKWVSGGRSHTSAPLTTKAFDCSARCRLTPRCSGQHPGEIAPTLLRLASSVSVPASSSAPGRCR